MSGMETLLAPVDLLPQTGFRVWGIDPSSKRIALAVVEGDGSFAVSSRPLPSGEGWREMRFADSYAEQVDLFKAAFADGRPSIIFIEEPFVPRDRRQVPTHLLMYGVTLAALGEVIAASQTPLVELTASQWKARALGQGNGHAPKEAVLRWAQQIGYEGRVQDEADAIGIAIGGAHLQLAQERTRAAA